MNGYKWKAAICCESGPVRKNNEDNFYFNGLIKPIEQSNINFVEETKFKGKGLFAVFDGMGGESYGEVASYIAASLLRDYAKKIFTQEQIYFEQYFIEANRRICLEAEKRHETIGTTLVMAAISKNHLQVYNLGDSRAYLLQKDKFICLTEDHTTSTNRPFLNQRSHSLSQYLGVPEDEFIIEPYCADIGLIAGDKILLCSDGLTDMLCEDVLKSFLLMGMHPKQIARKLADASIAAGGKDNITALIIAC